MGNPRPNSNNSTTYFDGISNDLLAYIVRLLSETSHLDKWRAGINEGQLGLLFPNHSPFRGVINELFKSVLINESLEWYEEDFENDKLILSGNAADRIELMRHLGSTLEEIVINNAKSVPAAVLKDLSSVCKNLEVLVLRGNLNNVTWMPIAVANAHCLQKLGLDSCTHLALNASTLSTKLHPTVKSLTLGKLTKTDYYVKLIEASRSTLEYLRIRGGYTLDVVGKRTTHSLQIASYP